MADTQRAVEHHQHPTHYKVIVNTREKTVDTRTLTFDQLIALAFSPQPAGPNIEYTITYRHGPPENREGELLKGQSVVIRDGIIFNVDFTDKS
jgi:hypothetical protein